jgi:hypothetical protein
MWPVSIWKQYSDLPWNFAETSGMPPASQAIATATPHFSGADFRKNNSPVSKST